MCQLLISYQCHVPVGTVVAVVPDTHQFSHNERQAVWNQCGNDPLKWHRKFTVLAVTDRTVEDLRYLTDPLMLAGTVEPTPHPSGLGQWYFSVPAVGTPEYESLSTTGEWSGDWATASQYLVERV